MIRDYLHAPVDPGSDTISSPVRQSRSIHEVVILSIWGNRTRGRCEDGLPRLIMQRYILHIACKRMNTSADKLMKKCYMIEMGTAGPPRQQRAATGDAAGEQRSGLRPGSPSSRGRLVPATPAGRGSARRGALAQPPWQEEAAASAAPSATLPGVIYTGPNAAVCDCDRLSADAGCEL